MSTDASAPDDVDPFEAGDEPLDVGVNWLDEAVWAEIQAAIPIVCVDMIAVRRAGTGASQVGLIRRTMPPDDREVWCLMGGRLGHGETVRAGLFRHLTATLSGVTMSLPVDPQPSYLMQWFPDGVAAERDALPYGFDPRRHSVGLCFVVELTGTPLVVPGGEGLSFSWLDLDELPGQQEEMWPGTLTAINGGLRQAGITPAD
jgi:Domain of unknown function (DUF4916)